MVNIYFSFYLKSDPRGTWMAQSVECPTLAQVTISLLVSSSPTWGSDADSSEPGLLWILCLPLSLPLTHLHSVSASLKNK